MILIFLSVLAKNIIKINCLKNSNQINNTMIIRAGKHVYCQKNLFLEEFHIYIIIHILLPMTLFTKAATLRRLKYWGINISCSYFTATVFDIILTHSFFYKKENSIKMFILLIWRIARWGWAWVISRIRRLKK